MTSDILAQVNGTGFWNGVSHTLEDDPCCIMPAQSNDFDLDRYGFELSTSRNLEEVKSIPQMQGGDVTHWDL